MNVASSAPAEVIARIAMEVQLAFPLRRNLIYMSHVCKSWREAVISYPLLWNTIDHDIEVVTRMCLERSESLPLTISLSNFSHWSRDTWRLIGSQASRFEELCLDGSLSSGLADIFSFLTPGEGPLLLRELSLVDSRGSPDGWWYLRSPILSKDIPTLHKLSLSSFPLILQLSVLRHLTILDLDDPGSTSTNVLLHLLANNPSLQQVGITGPLDNQESYRGDQSIILPHLCFFRVDKCATVNILRCLHLPRSEPLEIHIQFSFQGVDLPQVYQPYSVIQLARDFKFPEIHLYIGSKFDLEIHGNSAGGITAEFVELPPNTAEVLGLSTVQFIKYFRFWEDQGHQSQHPLEFMSSLCRMQRLETLALDCLPASFEDIFRALNMDAMSCRLLRTLIVQLPEGVPVVPWKVPLLRVVRSRANRGVAIWRLRVIVESEGHVQLYSGIFDPFVQEIEIVVRQPRRADRKRWLVWED